MTARRVMAFVTVAGWVVVSVGVGMLLTAAVGLITVGVGMVAAGLLVDVKD